MLLSPRKHLYTTNIIIFFIIFILQKFITLFCIIEEKACKNKNCPAEKCCGKHCVEVAAAEAPSLSSIHRPTIKRKNFTLIPTSLRKTMRNFGFEEGHYQIFVEEKQRYQPTSEARLNAVEAELKLNPN